MRPSIALLAKLIILSIPLDLCAASYLLFDPFKLMQSRAAVADGGNRDYVSTETFLHQADRENYDSFIFGNSRSFAFLASEWGPMVGASAPFHFDASGESLFGIRGKLRLLDRRGAKIRNALIIVDASVLSAVTDTPELLYVKHPAISGSSWASFQTIFFEAYASPKFFLPYVYERETGKRLPGFPLDLESPMDCDLVTNDCRFTRYEKALATDRDGYYRAHASVFYPRAPHVGHNVLGEPQRALLEEIRTVLVTHATDCRVVVSPLYDEVAISPADLSLLERVFGKGRVHDFSGVNEFTADIHNFYEDSHYRPPVARKIMSEIYGRALSR